MSSPASPATAVEPARKAGLADAAAPEDAVAPAVPAGRAGTFSAQ